MTNWLYLYLIIYNLQHAFGNILTINGQVTHSYRLNFQTLDVAYFKSKMQCLAHCKETVLCRSVNVKRVDHEYFECDMQTQATEHITYLSQDVGSSYVCKYYLMRFIISI